MRELSNKTTKPAPKFTIAEILSKWERTKTTESGQTKPSIDKYGIYKAIKRRTISRSNAEELERVTGIPRERWMWPGHYKGQDPWKFISIGGSGSCDDIH